MEAAQLRVQLRPARRRRAPEEPVRRAQDRQGAAHPGGNFKVPVSPEWLTSAAKIDFIERNSSPTPSPPPGTGASKLSGDRQEGRVHAGRLPGRRTRRTQSRADTTVAGRLEAGVLKGLDLGVSSSQGKVNADAGRGRGPLPRGLPVHAPSQLPLLRSALRGRDAPAAGGRRALPATAPSACAGNSSVTTGAQRPGLGLRRPAHGGGARMVASATWLVTGEKKTRTIKPEHPLYHGGVGRDRARRALRHPATSTTTGRTRASRARATAPATSGPWAAQTWTGGLSWWPVELVRLYGQRRGRALRRPPAGARAGPEGELRDHPGPAPGLGAVSAGEHACP